MQPMADEKERDPSQIKRGLDETVEKLEQSRPSSADWGDKMAANREKWEELKKKIHDRQKTLKRLVKEKRAGTIGEKQFNKKYRKIQDELTNLEFAVYNLRLGTDIET